MNKLKIGYFADGPWSHHALDKLISDETVSIEFICARNDTPDPVLKGKATEHHLDFITHPSINSEDFLHRMQGYGCDLFVSMSFNQIFRKELMETPPLKTINCHAGKLPYYRGRNILNWALINDEREFGITVHYVDEGIDTGDIILQRCYPITDVDNYSTLLNRAYGGCANTLYDAIKLIQADQVTPIRQESIHPLGFYCTARRVGDERIDWKTRSREVFNFVRAISSPGPQARTMLGQEEVRINKVEFLQGAPAYKGIPGAIIGLEGNSFFVKTSDSYIKVVEWNGNIRPKIGKRLV